MPAALSAAALAAMRASVERAFDQRITRERVTRVDDGAGGWTETVSTATYPGRVETRTAPTERVQGGRLTAATVYLVRLPHDADVQPADRLLAADVRLQVADTDGLKSQRLQLVVNCWLVT